MAQGKAKLLDNFSAFVIHITLKQGVMSPPSTAVFIHVNMSLKMICVYK